VDHPARIRAPRRSQPSFPELAEQRIQLIGQDSDRLTERTVPAVAREKDVVSAPREDTEGRVVQGVVAIRPLEVQNLGTAR
jgi:hypothetical protein